MILDAMAMSPQQQCQLRPGQTAQAIRPYGVLDLALTNQYWLFPRFRNMMEPIGTITGEGEGGLQSETHYLSIQGATSFVNIGEFMPTSREVSLLRIALKYLDEGVHSFVAAGVAPSQEGVVAVQVVPPELGNVLDQKMRAHVQKPTVADPAVWITVYVKLEAQTQDRYVVKSNEFSFPVMLCWGCLVMPFIEEAAQDWPCFIGQDEPLPLLACPFVANHPEACPAF
jgi:hypothetical protein